VEGIASITVGADRMSLARCYPALARPR